VGTVPKHCEVPNQHPHPLHFMPGPCQPQAYYKGFYVRGTGRWPNLERWFAALETRPTYMGTKSDYYTHCHDLPPQLGGMSYCSGSVTTGPWQGCGSVVAGPSAEACLRIAPAKLGRARLGRRVYGIVG
jgi:hypothetical protein